MKSSITLALVTVALIAICPAAAGVGGGEARTALQKAVRFFRSHVATQGGYLWRYSSDLAKREGEGKAGRSTVWVQPPGTPAVGLALLEAHQLTDDETCLAGAVDAARCLVRGQLHSGGWPYRIDFEPSQRRRFAFRIDGKPAKKARDISVLDDNTTQAATRLMVRVDQALGFKDKEIHDTALSGLSALLRHQFESGAWPQVFTHEVRSALCPPRPASIPAEWSRTYTGHHQYWYRPTLNDGVIADVIRVLLEAAEIYDAEKYRAAALRGGEFLLRAQLPEPQPGWAQQYDYTMRPIWARKFEPPAVTGGEAKGVIATLIWLYEYTGQKRWLEPVPRALAYYRRCRLPDGRLARFYELGTNRPLYFTRAYKLTHDDSDMPTHYAFKIAFWGDDMARRFERAEKSREQRPAVGQTSVPEWSGALAAKAAEVIKGLDERGAWVEDGKLKYHGKADTTNRIVDCRTFCRNVDTLARFIAAAEARAK